MDRKIFRIEMESLRRCVEHLQTLDLSGMEVLAARHGTPDDVQLIAHVKAFVSQVPLSH